MSQVQNAQPSTTARYPKRKRAQVDYAEQETESEEYGSKSESQDAVEYAQKKRKSASSRPLPKRKIFPFMQLPAEIRNSIYELCLTGHVGIYLRSTTKKFRRTVHQVSQSDLIGEHYHCFESFDGVGHSNEVSNADSPSDTDDSSSSEDEGREKATEVKNKKRGPSEEIAPLVPALLAVCKQMYYESRDLLYSNHFYLENPLALHSFLVDIGPRAALLLKNISLMAWSTGRGHKSYNHTCFTALMAATNLESFNTHDRCYSEPKWLAAQMYRDGFPWMEAIGREKGRADAAVDIFNVKCPSYNTADKMEEFRTVLRKLLNMRMERIRS